MAWAGRVGAVGQPTWIGTSSGPWFTSSDYAAQSTSGPTVYPKWIADFQNNRYASGAFNGTVTEKTFADLLTFSRGSSATTTTTPGRIVPSATDTPRLAFNPATGTSLGLQMEAQYTNGFSFSGDISNGTYTVPAGTKTNDFGILSPDFVANAGGVTHSGAAGDRMARNFTYPISSRVTVYAFVKPLDNLNARPALQLNNGTAFPGASGLTYFDLPTLTVTNTANVLGGVESFGNGWYFIWVSASTSATSASTDTRLYVDTNGSTAGNRTAIWGFETIESASPISYIPTTTVSVTKLADFATSTTVTSFNPTKGSFVATFLTPYLKAGTRTIFKLDDGTTSNGMSIQVDGTTRAANFVVTTAGVEQANLSLGTVDENTVQKIAVNYNLNSFVGSLNGGATVSDTLGTVPAFTTVRVGHNISTNWEDGYIQTISAYADTLTSAELTRLSTITAPANALRSVVTENRVNNATDTYGATNQLSRFRVTVGTDASEFVLNINNRWLNTTSDGTTGNAITIQRVSIEKDSTSQYTPVTFGGNRTRVLNSGDFDINSDRVLPSAFGLSKFTRGEVYWVRCEVSIPSTGNFMPYSGRTNNPTGTQFGFYNPGSTTVTNGVDGTGLYTVTGTALDLRQTGYTPMVLGRPTDRNARVFIGIGDSIHFGVGDNMAIQPNNGYGTFQRAMTAGDDVTNPLPSINLNRGGATTLAFNNDWMRSYFKYANVLVDECGTNDIGLVGTGNVTTIQNNLTAIYNNFKSIQFGGRIVRTFLLPRTTSTDSWATIANQTYVTDWEPAGKSAQMNAWTDARVSDGTLVARVGTSAVADGTDPYKWVVNGTASYMSYDGTHFGNLGTTIRAAEVRTVLTAL